jgi:RNA polymerase sigma-70 factor (ECF subfamily)
MASTFSIPANPSSASGGGPDDYALMEGVRGRDANCFSLLYDRYSPTVFGLCLRALHDRMEAEDLLTDIFWELWERGQRYDAGRGSPASYLMGVARSRVVDRLRTKKSRRRLGTEPSTGDLDFAADPRSDGKGPAEAIDVAERRARVQAAMQSLSASQRQALEMAFFDSMTHTQVAEQLREPVGTVKSRIRQALIQLRKVLGAEP